MQEIVPSGVERTFADDDIIVSKTDPTGHLTYVNDVFLAVSGFEERELIGRPHNIIRHPDMPAAVFKLLWDELLAGREVFAYVVNLAKDGAHYWVHAHVTPTFGHGGAIVGFHSNRRTADRSSLTAVVPVYERIRAAERTSERRSEQVTRGTAELATILGEVEMTYDEWVWSLVPEEVAA